MTLSIPDDGVEGENTDLGRMFELSIRGQENTNRILEQLRDTANRSLLMSQQFSTGRNGAPISVPGVAGPLAGHITTSSLSAAFRTVNGGHSIGSGIVLPVGMTPLSAGGGLAPGTLPLRPAQAPFVPAMPNSAPTANAPVSTPFSTGSTTLSALRSRVGRAMVSALLPGMGQNGSAAPQSGSGGSGNPVLGQTQQPPQAPPGGRRRAIPPVSPGGGLWPGGYTPGSPYGPYGPYGPFGTSGGASGSGSGGSGGGGVNPLGADQTDVDDGHMYGMNSGIGQWLRKYVPGVDLIDKGWGEMRSQRDKNAYYQNIEGGSNTDAFSERWDEEKYAFTTQALFSSQEARDAYKGVTRLGFTGKTGVDFSQQGSRQDALNFTYNAKAQYGATVNESLQELEVVSKNSALSLTQVQKALKEVSDVAGQTGVNAQMARSQLTSLIQTAMGAGYGAGSVSTAQNIQMGQTTLGRSFQNLDLSGQMGQQYTYMAASNSGMTYNQYVAMQATNPLAASQARAGQNLQVLSQIFSADELQWIKNKAQAMGGKLDPNSAISLVPAFEQAFPNHNTQVITQQLAAFGIVQSSDPTEALAYAFNLIAGNNGDLASAEIHHTQNTPMSADSAKAQESTNPSLIKGFNAYMPPAPKMAGGAAGPTDADHSRAMQNYKDEVKSAGGQRNPVIESLLKSVKGNPDQQTVAVHTSSGVRIMSLADAIKSHPMELSSGQVQFVSGSEQGKSVADVVGQDKVNSGADWTTEAAGSKDTAGMSLQDWEKKNPNKTLYGTGKETGSNGTVIIDLSAEAQKLLKIASATGIAGANGEGAPPINSYPYNANR